MSNAFARRGLHDCGSHALLGYRAQVEHGQRYFKAYAKVEAEGKVQVPQHLQDANRDARDLGHGEGYVYPHEQPGHHVFQQYLPTALLGAYVYSPSKEGYKAGVKDRLALWRAAQRKALGI